MKRRRKSRGGCRTKSRLSKLILIIIIIIIIKVKRTIKRRRKTVLMNLRAFLMTS